MLWGPRPPADSSGERSFAYAVRADVNAVEKLPDILVFHEAGLAYARVDGEVRIHQPHSVFELLLDSVEEILDVAAHGAEAGELLRGGEVHPRKDHLPAVL